MSPYAARRADVDSLRVLALSLLIVFHVLLVYGPEDWRVKSEHAGNWAQYIVALLTPWRMPLVFFIGGIAARFMMEKRSTGRFIFDRAAKLMTAFVFAVVAIMPLQRFVRMDPAYLRQHDYFYYLTHDARYVVETHGIWLPDFANAWFLPYLFAYSLTAVLIFRLLPKLFLTLQRFVEQLPLWALVLSVMAWFGYLEAFFIPQHPTANVFVDDWDAHLKFAPIFAIGVLVGKSNCFQQKTAAARNRLIAAAAFLFLASFGVHWVSNHIGAPHYARDVMRGVFGGDMLFAVFAFGQSVLNRRSSVLTYGTDAVMPVYLMHQSVLVLVASVVVGLHWPLALELPVLMLTTGLIPLAIYQVAIRHNPPLRMLFGLRPSLRGEPPTPPKQGAEARAQAAA